MSDADALPAPVRLRRALALGLWVVVVGVEVLAAGALAVPEDVRGAARNVVFPGLGFLEWSLAATAIAALVAFVALACWLAWGADWLVALVWSAAAVLALVFVPATHEHAGDALRAAPPARVLRSSHEFAAVMVLVAALRWLRLRTLGRPSVRRLLGRDRRQVASGSAPASSLGTVDRCRAAAIAGLARRAGLVVPEAEAVVAGLRAPEVERRARRVAALARWRFGGDPLRADMAPVRAALAMCGELSAERIESFRADAERCWAGVPASEPTWVRPLDATLAAAALWDLGATACAERWTDAFERRLRLRHGRRPAWLHAPTGAVGGAVASWEHAVATGLARAFGWTDDEDWPALRRRCLAAAARGAGLPHNQRLIAAGRLWAVQVDDAPALRVLRRPTLSGDPLALVLDRIASALADRPLLLRRDLAADAGGRPSAVAAATTARPSAPSR